MKRGLIFLLCLFLGVSLVEGKIISPVVSGTKISGVVREDNLDIGIGNAHGGLNDRIWRENRTTSGILKFWSLMSVPAGTTQRWYIYYGKDYRINETDHSNAEGLFTFYDDFNALRINEGTKWTILATTNKPVIENGALKVSWGSDIYKEFKYGLGVMRSKTSFDPFTSIIEYKMRYNTTAGSGFFGIGWTHPTEDRNYFMHQLRILQNPPQKITVRVEQGYHLDTRVIHTDKYYSGAWYSFVLSSNKSEDNNATYTLYETSMEPNNTLISWGHKRIMDLGQAQIGIHEKMRSLDDSHIYAYIDDIRVRKYVIPEPIVTYGAEEVGVWGQFTRRRPITIVNNTGKELVQYQVCIPIKMVSLVQPVRRVMPVQ